MDFNGWFSNHAISYPYQLIIEQIHKYYKLQQWINKLDRNTRSPFEYGYIRMIWSMSKNISIILTTLCFLLIHLYLFNFLSIPLGILFLLLIAAGSILWGYLYIHFGNICFNAISHGIVAFVLWRYLFFSIN